MSLLKTADRLVENLKPGSLARLGFGTQELHEINPRLVCCGISDFGASSIFPGRPAFDTVVQTISGFMDVTRSQGAPTKAGICAANIVGGEYGLLAILGALEMRDQNGLGVATDISMQDAAVSATASLRNVQASATQLDFLQCADGCVCIEHACASQSADALRKAASTLKRSTVVAEAATQGITAVPVNTLSECATRSQTIVRQRIVEKPGDDGRAWPLLASGLRLSYTPPPIRQPIGTLGEANAGMGAKAK